MFDLNLFMVSLFFSMVGIGFYMYGKNQSPYFRLSGFLLMVFPYFISSYFWMILIGILIMIIPFILVWFRI